MSDVRDLTPAMREPPTVTKVLLLGNSGVGKSMLLNVLLGRPAFESKLSAAAVTKAVETEEYRAADGRLYLLYNIPGLIDVDEQVALLNAAAVEKAIRDRAGLPTIAFFVLTVEGGRLRAEDLEAWQAIANFVPDIKRAGTMAFIVNKVRHDEFPSDQEQAEFKRGLERALEQLCGARFATCMLPSVGKQQRDNLQSESMANVRGQLTAAVMGMRGSVLTLQEGSRLMLHEQRLREEIAAMRRLMDDMVRRKAAQAEAAEGERKRPLDELGRDKIRRQDLQLRSIFLYLMAVATLLLVLGRVWWVIDFGERFVSSSEALFSF